MALGGRTGSSLTLEESRIKLEGRLELLEQAAESYSLLERGLRRRQWWQIVSERRVLLRQVVAGEPALQDALVALHRRAQQEHWHAEAPALRLVARMEGLRQQLIRRAQACLRQPGAPGMGLVDCLLELERKVPEVRPLAEDERVLIRRDTSERSWLLFRLTVSGRYAQAGELLVTQERLIWQPRGAPPIQVLRRSLKPGGVTWDYWGDHDILIVELLDGPPLRLYLGFGFGLVLWMHAISKWDGSSHDLIQAVEAMSLGRKAPAKERAIGGP